MYRVLVLQEWSGVCFAYLFLCLVCLSVCLTVWRFVWLSVAGAWLPTPEISAGAPLQMCTEVVLERVLCQ